MPRGMERPMAALVLSDGERSFLEAQVRRHREARSMSDRCRMILRCVTCPRRLVWSRGLARQL